MNSKAIGYLIPQKTIFQFHIKIHINLRTHFLVQWTLISNIIMSPTIITFNTGINKLKSSCSWHWTPHNVFSWMHKGKRNTGTIGQHSRFFLGGYWGRNHSDFLKMCRKQWRPSLSDKLKWLLISWWTISLLNN